MNGFDSTKYETCKPEEATHVYADGFGTKALPCAYPRSLSLRWLREIDVVGYPVGKPEPVKEE